MTGAPGEIYLSDTPALRSHEGTQPDLFLRWNHIPASVDSVDVVIHLHGFSQESRAMPLAEKVASSGLDLSRRTRPTLAMLPRGNWIRHYYYDFPALLSGGIDELIDYGLQCFAWATKASHPFAVDRVILTAHSGGGRPTNFTYSTGFTAGILPRAIRWGVWKLSTGGSPRGWSRSRTGGGLCG